MSASVPARRPRRKVRLAPLVVNAYSSPDQMMLSSKSTQARVTRQPIGARDLLFLSAWSGLAAGLLEVGTRVVCRAIEPSQRLYLVSHHFIWLSPLSNLAFFMVIGLVLAAATKLAPRATGWIGPRLICVCTILPVLIAAQPRVYTSAWLLVSAGFAVSLVPIFGRHRTALRTWLVWSFPVMLGLVFALAGFVFGRDWLQRARVRPPVAAVKRAQRPFHRA